MAQIYKKITITSGGPGSDDKRLKVSTDDTQSGFLEEKFVVASARLNLVTLNPGANEQMQIDVDETAIDHDNLLNYDIEQHRVIDDISTTATSMWSSTKIQTELDSKINAATPMTDNKLVRSVGISGVDVEATGINVDDLDNVTGINDLTLDGDLTVNGTTTSVNSTTLNVTDANITINNGGTQASADAQDAGITVEMSDAIDAQIGYDSTLASNFKVGEIGSESEIISATHTQTISNKTINVDNNTLSNVETDNLKAGVLATDLDLAVDNTKLAGAQAIKDYVVARVAEKDAADEISYSNISSGLAATEVQAAIDEVEGRVDTAETTLTSHLNADPGKHAANQVNYTNTTSDLTATDVQAAIDEVEGRVDTNETNISTNTGNIGTNTSGISDHIADAVDAHDASAISNVAAGTIIATDVQAAINELDTEKYVAADFDGDFDTRLGTKSTTDLTEGTNLYFTNARANVSAGDLIETTFAGAASAASASVTGFAFANGTVRSFDAQVSVVVDATADLYEEYEIHGIQRGADWVITVSSTGDDALIDFDIDATGQVTYSSDAYVGFSAMDVRFKARTTGV